MANTQNTQQTVNNNAIFQVPTDQEVRAMSKAKAREAIATYEKQKEGFSDHSYSVSDISGWHNLLSYITGSNLCKTNRCFYWNRYSY